jgi:hypothetical protein
MSRWDCQKSGHIWQMGKPLCRGCGVPWVEWYDGPMQFSEPETLEIAEFLDACASQEHPDN